jgi:Kef-type K+ transport system membrane component KefB
LPLSPHQLEALLASVLVELIVIVIAARLLGGLVVALRQPRAVGEIVAGLVLGPSLLGALAPDVFATLFAPSAAPSIAVLSQIGLLLLMFQIGADFEFHRLSEASGGATALAIALASVGAPLLCGFALAWIGAPWLAPDLNRILFSAFVAVALAITAVPILGRILREYGLVDTRMGVVAISAAALNDLLGWLLLASLAAVGSATFTFTGLALRIGGLAAMGAAVWLLGPRVGQAMLARFPLKDGQAPGGLIAAAIVMTFACGLTTQALGVFTILGGFIVGLLFHRERAFVAAWRRQVGGLVLVFFLPIFFASTGLRTNVTALSGLAAWMWCLGFLALACLTKILPVAWVARVRGFSSAEAMTLGALMNTRALMALIVLNVGLSLGLLPASVFTMLVLMALATTAMTGPLLRFFLPKCGFASVPNDEA